MRYESAMKVVRCLRESLSEPLSILTICSRIELSYQPTHRHVRELEAAGVVCTKRAGREVLCLLADSDQAALWLALASVEDTEQLMAGGADPLAEKFVLAAHAGRLGEILGLAVVPKGNSREVIAVLPSGADHAAVRTRAQALCDAHAGSDVQVAAFSGEQFMRRLIRDWTPTRFANDAQVLVGHQQVWRAVLAAASVKPPAAKAGRKSVSPRPARQPRQALKGRDKQAAREGQSIKQ